MVEEEQLSEHPAWKVLAGFLGNDLAGVRSAFIGKVGLALSGGGFRASLFHIGVLAGLPNSTFYGTWRFYHASPEARSWVPTITSKSNGYSRQKPIPNQSAGYIDIVHHLESHFLKGVQSNIRTRVFANPIKNLKMAVSSGYTRTHRAGELYERSSTPESTMGRAPRRATCTT